MKKYKIAGNDVILYLDADSALDILLSVSEEYRVLESVSLGTYAIRLISPYIVFASDTGETGNAIVLLTRDKDYNTALIVMDGAEVRVTGINNDDALEEIVFENQNIRQQIRR